MKIIAESVEDFHVSYLTSGHQTDIGVLAQLAFVVKVSLFERVQPLLLLVRRVFI